MSKCKTRLFCDLYVFQNPMASIPFPQFSPNFHAKDTGLKTLQSTPVVYISPITTEDKVSEVTFA